MEYNITIFAWFVLQNTLTKYVLLICTQIKCIHKVNRVVASNLIERNSLLMLSEIGRFSETVEKFYVV